ncbi:MAG: shikimate dehydrogenase [Anaerolineae bacterium]|nr:shikimate dehydrogenase [Anaerolineae bacterium]MDH7474534.1 shikimate dehydrogenase [Anaerolineae bacterium]
MDNFAFVIHPIDPKRDVERKFPLLGRLLPVSAINFLSRFFPPIYISHITGIRSAATGKEIEGWFVACPLTPARMMQLPTPVAYHKIVQTGHMAEKLGARLLGLGAFTAVVGDAGVTIASRLSIPVTTGNSYTIAVAVQAVREAAQRMDIPLSQATAAVVGATGAIGRVCAQLLATDVPQLILVGRRMEALEKVAELTRQRGQAQLQTTTDITAIHRADLVLTVTSAIETIIDAHHLKTGAVVCDVSRPRGVSRQVVEQRDDVLVIEGGMVDVPGDVDFGFDFGFPPKTAYACMAETMILALEGRYESYTLGREITIEQVTEIERLAEKHGFRLAGFRSFERAVTDEYIEQIKENARRKRGGA